jgi:hypothetical protein
MGDDTIVSMNHLRQAMKLPAASSGVSSVVRILDRRKRRGIQPTEIKNRGISFES